MRKVLCLLLSLGVLFINVCSLQASANAVKVVDAHYNNNRLNSDNTFYLNNSINTTTSDLDNGKVNIEITLVNNSSEEQSAIGAVVYFDDYIINNFDIGNLSTTSSGGTVTLQNNVISWAAGNIAANTTVKLTYTLSTKSAVNSSIIGSTLRTNSQIIVTSSGYNIGVFPSTNVNDNICSPTIQILAEGVSNPQTGIVDNIILGACILCGGLMTYVIMKAVEDKYSRI